MTFAARGVWGALPAKGRLTGLSGAAIFHENGRIEGELTIPAGSLESGNRLGDRHLKSSAFLDVRRYRHIRFQPHRLADTSVGHVIEPNR